MKRKEKVKRAIRYMDGGKSFRNFENSKGISAHESGAIWGEAAKRVKKEEDAALEDANREMFGDDMDFFDEAGIDNIGHK
jgi:hypothetical protein